jgi:ubiquinone/menaquinone biosynthesis C-methylase UbiE
MAARISDKEMKLISMISRLISLHGKADCSGILAMIDQRVPDMIGSWAETAEKLERKGLITQRAENSSEKLFGLTAEGRKYADAAERNYSLVRFFYNEFFRRAEKSDAHANFCRMVYGRNFCQHGMLDMYQLNRMIETGGICESSRVLELGCGNGHITEYIFDRTQCRITGIDIADKAISAARRRTKEKSRFIDFRTMSMDKLKFAEQSFDFVLSIDSLYFVKDLEDTIMRMKRVLKPGGAMLIFYHFPPEADTRGEDPSRASKLGKTLDKMGLQYSTTDFTKENRRHWKTKKDVLLVLKDAFEAEGNVFLYNNRISECEDNFHEFHRYLYIVSSGSGSPPPL